MELYHLNDSVRTLHYSIFGSVANYRASDLGCPTRVFQTLVLLAATQHFPDKNKTGMYQSVRENTLWDKL